MPWNLRRVSNVMHSFFAHQTDTLFLSIEKHKSFYLKSLSMKIVEEDCSDMTPPLMNWSKVWKAILVKIFLFHSRYLISSHLCGHMFFDSKVGLTRHSKHRVKTGYMIGIHKITLRDSDVYYRHTSLLGTVSKYGREIKFNIENNKTDYFQMSCRICFMVLVFFQQWIIMGWEFTFHFRVRFHVVEILQ